MKILVLGKNGMLGHVVYNYFLELGNEVIKEISKYKNSVIGIVMDKENCYKNKSEYIKNHNDLYATALHLLM